MVALLIISNLNFSCNICQDMRYLIVYILIALSTTCFAQENNVIDRKSILKEIKSFIKSENYSKVNDLVKDAMNKYSELSTDKEFYNIWMNANYNLALSENRNIYLQNRPDTVKYMSYIYATFAHGLRCDSLDELPNTKGKIKRKYKDNIYSKLKFYRSNLENAGKFFYNKKDYEKALSFIKMYLRGEEYFHNQTSDSVLSNRKDLALLAVLSSYAISKYADVITFLPYALTDSSTNEKLLEIGCKAYSSLKQSEEMFTMLNEGFFKYPNNEFFFATIIKEYNSLNNYEKSLIYAKKMTELYPKTRRYWYIRGKQEQLIEDYDSAIISFTNAIKLQTDDAESYSSLGDIYKIKAYDFDKDSIIGDISLSENKSLFKKSRDKLNNLYKLSMNYYELAKKYAEDNTSLWLTGLKEAYYNLNMGEELKKLEKYK